MSSPFLPHDPSLPPVQPNFTVPKTLGFLNITFGVLMMLCGLCMGFQYVVQPLMGPMFDSMQQQIEAQQAAQVENLRSELERAEAEENEQEKERIQSQLDQLESMPDFDFGKLMTFRDPRVFRWGIVDLVSGLLLNLLLIVSGIGLMMFQSWGRMLALWVAALKILRLLLSQLYFIVVCAPIIGRQTQEMFDRINEMAQKAGGTGGPPPPMMPNFAQLQTITNTATAVAWIVFGSIYPIVLLLLLNGKRTKAAFRQPDRLPPI